MVNAQNHTAVKRFTRTARQGPSLSCHSPENVLLRFHAVLISFRCPDGVVRPRCRCSPLGGSASDCSGFFGCCNGL
ncbi:hypothetical protein NDU88_003182 [Pleurodeles waltl]|uniref:Uncharacterized protein n=1 Tax=Pleurodeles waltl TaxID=8319 RepID=A0AAV7UZV4_PLEWA|nr:hypothetical protein NDU88_003182 [Pleurodeles waltl]